MKVIAVTVAFNAQSTIVDTIRSILSQSYSNFVYYIINNGSTDNTEKIIKKYAKNDKRIVLISKPKNNIWAFFEILPSILERHNKNDYLCCIDADDIYVEDFMEKMIIFMKKNKLDIAACGNDFIDCNSNKVISRRILNEDLVLCGNGFGDYLDKYYAFIRTIWAKMYSMSILIGNNFKAHYEMGYGGDTIFAIETFNKAKRVGILSESLHKYYISTKSASYIFNEKRIISDRILFNEAYKFILNKVGYVSKRNNDFLLKIYFYAIVDTINVILNSPIDMLVKVVCLIDIYISTHTKLLIKAQVISREVNSVLNQISKWISYQEENLNTYKNFKTLKSILSEVAMHFFKVDMWKDDGLFILLLKIRKEMKDKNMIDKLINSFISKFNILYGDTIDFYEEFKKVICLILQQKEKEALEEIENLFSMKIDIDDRYINDIIQLGLNLSAKLEYEEYFVYFKKIQILMFINFSRLDEAKNELEEWNSILPNDDDFEELQKRLTFEMLN